MLEYNFTHILNTDIDFFESMPISKVMQYKDLPPFTICHGSHFKVNQSMCSDNGYIDGVVEQIETALVICGHFHIQTAYKRKGKLIVNPGALGVPLHSNGNTQFMILHDTNGYWQHDYFSLSYNIDRTIKSMDDEKLYLKAPGWYDITKHLLLTGETSHTAVVSKVMNKYFNNTGKRTLHEIPEEYWREAVVDLWVEDV